MSLETDIQHMLRSLSKKEMNAVAATWNEVMSKGNTGHLDQITWDALLPSYNPWVGAGYYVYWTCSYTDSNCTNLIGCFGGDPPTNQCGYFSTEPSCVDLGGFYETDIIQYNCPSGCSGDDCA